MQPSCARSTQVCLLLSLVLGCDRGTASPPGAFSGSGGTSQAGSSTSSGGQAGGSSTGGTGRRTTGAGGSGGRATGGASDAGGGPTGLRPDAGVADATSDSANAGSDDGGASDAGPADVRRPGRDGSDGSADTKNADDGADDAETGTGVCDISDPPANVAAWIDESWNAEGHNNINWHKTWLADSAMKGEGEIDICVRYGATRSVSATTRDQVASAMQRWFSKWLALLYPCDCFPCPSVAVKVTGWAVKPGQESLLQWSDRTVPVYTEVSDGTDQAKGEPKCPDACGFFFHPDHVFTGCPGGADNHFDYTLWLDDTQCRAARRPRARTGACACP
jgi:hypothetical protein